MIFVGLDAAEKARRVQEYVNGHRVDRVFVLTPKKLTVDFGVDAEVIEWAQIVQYRHFYRLLQEIDRHTLVIVNECLRTQNRYDLTYNCMRHFLAQTGHQLIFQHLPIIDSNEDFMTLFDFDTKSRWKRTRFEDAPLDESVVEVASEPVALTAVDVDAPAKLKAQYEKRKRELVDGIGLRDPHTIPRNLYLLGGKVKAAAADPWGWHVARNQRIKLDRLTTWKAESFPETYTAIELPHDFRDFIDFLTLSMQSTVPVMVADLKVDHWYFSRYVEWAWRVSDACAAIRR